MLAAIIFGIGGRLLQRREDFQFTGSRALRPDGCDKTARRANHFWFSEIVSSPEIKDISLYPKKNKRYIFTHPVPPEGRIMIVTIVGMGRGGRW